MLIVVVMQALSVLLTAISCRKHFGDFINTSVMCSRKLIHWLYCMRDSNDIARSAYRVICSIVTSSDPQIWLGIADMFLGEVGTQAEASNVHSSEQMYLSGAGEEQSLNSTFGQQADEHSHYRLNEV
jgi:hypothetical protein